MDIAKFTLAVLAALFPGQNGSALAQGGTSNLIPQIGETVQPLIGLPVWDTAPSRWFGQSFRDQSGSIDSSAQYVVTGSEMVSAFGGTQLWLQISAAEGSTTPQCADVACWVYFGDALAGVSAEQLPNEVVQNFSFGE